MSLGLDHRLRDGSDPLRHEPRLWSWLAAEGRSFRQVPRPGTPGARALILLQQGLTPLDRPRLWLRLPGRFAARFKEEFGLTPTNTCLPVLLSLTATTVNNVTKSTRL